MTRNPVPKALRPPTPPAAPCDMARGCKSAWVEYSATDKGSSRLIECKRTCRQHCSVCVAYMLTIANARIEVRIIK